MSRFRRLAPYFVIGPISGPLLAGAVINYREGRRVLAGLYVTALLEYAIVLPFVVAHLGVRLA
jgi:hypothetical protein